LRWSDHRSFVVLFDQDTPLELIDALKPDILVKGSDYKPEQVVGKELVESYGGCVRLVEVLQGYSTTGLAEKITGKNVK
jgi:D-beta-D-heptose 7-phosphate kinase / D-beta-D-heptose 1-phosphate adenosyltransferase